MHRTISRDNVWEEVNKWRVDPALWDAECVSNEATKTPGLFFHGPPDVNIERFQAQLSSPRASLQTTGAFFTHNPTYAALYVGDRGYGCGGRIYSAELVSRNPYYMPPTYWEATKGGDRNLESRFISDARAKGYDTVITSDYDGTFMEIVVLDDDVVRRRDDDIARVRGWSEGVSIFYQAEGAHGPGMAAGYIPLFGSRKEAIAHGCSVRAVAIDAISPLYCEQAIWPYLDFDILRHWRFGCLVDPRSRCALVNEESSVLRPVNRRDLRILQSSYGRRGYAKTMEKRLVNVRSRWRE